MPSNRVLIFTPYAEPEKGACTIRVNFFKSTLESAGFITLVVAPERGLKENSEVKRIKSKLELVKIILSFRPNAIIGVSPPLIPNFFLFLLAKVFNCTFILDAKDDGKFYARQNSDLISKIKTGHYLFLRWLLYSYSDKLIFLTISDLEEAKKNYKIVNEKMFIIMNGTDTSLVYRDEKQGNLYKSQLKISKNQKVVAYLGSLGDEELISFLKVIKDYLISKKIFLVLIVSFEDNFSGYKEIEGLEKAISELNLKNFIKIHKNVDYSEVKNILSACDIGIIPWPNNLITSIPVKVFDYLACGLAIAAKSAKNSELCKFILSNNVGFCCDNWNDFSKNLEILIKDEKQIKNLRNKNQLLAKKKFDRKFFKKKFLELFN